MEISVGNSEDSKTKSLDLKTLYQSEVSNKEGSVKKETTSWLENGEGSESKKRKNRKEVAVSSFEDLAERKKIRHSIDDVEVDEDDSCSAQSSGLGQKINGGSGFNVIGISIGGDSHGVLIPKRPRGTPGRNKFAKTHLLKPSASFGSVENVTKLIDEPKKVLQDEVSGKGEPTDNSKASSAEQIVKLNGNSGVKDRTKEKGVDDSNGNQKQELSGDGDFMKSVGSLGSKLKDEVKEIPQNKVSTADAPLSSNSLSSKDQVSKIKSEIVEIPQIKELGADAPLSSNSTSADQMGKLNGNSKGKLKNNVKRKGIDGNHKQKEEGTDLVLNRKDSSSKRNRRNHRKRKVSGSGSETVAKKVESSVTCDLDPDDDLEQNAARMLSSRFDPSCIGFASKNRTSALSSENGSEGAMGGGSDPASADAADRVLRPRRQQKGKGTSRKRRHFYEIHSDDMDAHWFLNRRIKIFWPLDESWYYGLVNDYDAEKNLHHIKYDDRDEEWISLENERFKLLLLPGEVPRKTNRKDASPEDEDGNKKKGSRTFHIKDESFMATHMESEPIISWLARSSHRVKSSPTTSFKKQKQSDFDNSMDVYKERETDKPNCSSAFLNISNKRKKNVREETNSSEEHVPIVYVRRRFRRFCDAANENDGWVTPSGNGFQSSAEDSVFLSWSLNSAGELKLDTRLVETKKFEVCISLWPMLRHVLGADVLWLVCRVLLLKYGTMVAMWPTVFLEVLFVDNIVGLRLFLFEGCLKQAVTFIFLVMKVFCGPEKDESVDQQIPVTSIRFKLSFVRDFRKQKLFAYYSFSKVRDSKWQYLDSEFQPHSLLAKQLSLPECTYDNVKLLEAGSQHSQIPSAFFEVLHKKSNPGAGPMLSSSRSPYHVPGSRRSTIYSLKNGNLPPFALSFSAAPNFFLSLHLKLLLERCISLHDHDSVPSLQESVHSLHPHASDQLQTCSESFSRSPSSEAAGPGVVTIDVASSKSPILVLDANSNVNTPPQTVVPVGSSKLKGITVEIPKSDEVYTDCRKATPPSAATQVTDLGWNLSDDMVTSPNPTGPRSLWHRSKSWADGKTDIIGNGFGNGPKKPRTQVQYTLPSREFNFKNKGHSQTGLPYQRIRKANDKKTSDTSKPPRRNLELVACDANILINGGDKGWRECGARVSLEVADQNEWKLAVKRGGELKYSYKVHQDLQPGSTNRYTHAMMWKGGKDWALEFPDRSQWFLFKEMHEECHNRNIRAASIKNIPIPGVRLIETSVDDQEDMPFVRNSWYFRQVRNDVEMAMDASRVMYDMDSEDEEWVSNSRASCRGSEDEMMSDEIFEKVMDMLEKVSYAQKRDQFTCGEVDELIARVSPMKVAKSVYEHWREKRQRKGMPLIRQLQPPLWERYQQICKEWDQSQPKLTSGPVSGSQEKASAGEKPPMFAFCLKPRGLELLNKGSKHRPHKKISLSGHSHAFLGDHDTHHSSGRRVNPYVFGDDRVESSEVSPLVSRMYSPRDGGGPGHFSLDGDTSEFRLQRNNSKTIKPLVSPKPAAFRKAAAAAGKRSNGKRPNNHPFPDYPSPPYRHPAQLLLGGSDLDEFRLRDASSAAKHARNMAKLKRERAQKLMLSADLAIHKAVSALMTAEAIKTMRE